MQPTPNQPILFYQEGDDPECCAVDGWQSYYFNVDPIRFQFLVDPCFNAPEQFINPVFEDGSGWTAANGAVFGAGEAVLPNNSSSIRQYVNGGFYRVEIVVSEAALSAADSTISISGIGDGAITFASAPGTYVFYGLKPLAGLIFITHYFSVSTGGNDAVVLTYASAKSVTYPTVSIINADTGAEIESVFGASVGGASNAISYDYLPSGAAQEAGKIQIQVSRTCGESVELWLSETICITDPNPCDILIGGCGQNNIFQGDFMPLIRLKGEIKRGVGYETDRTLNESALAKHTLVYGRRNKIDQLGINLVPEHVRDFLYFLPMFNSIGVRVGQRPQDYYFAREDADEPQFPDAEKNLANVVMRFVRKQFLEETQYENDCFAGVPPTVIGDSRTGFGGINQEAIQTAENELISG